MNAAPVTKKLEDLVAGETWSIHPKAKKFVLVNINPKSNVIESRGVDGAVAVMAYSDLKEMPVFSHHEPEAPRHDWNPELWQRVCLNGGAEDQRGTVVDINDQKPPDLDIVVLWDTPMNKRWMTEQHSTELALLNEACAEDVVARAKEARSLVKDLQNEYQRGHEDTTRKVVQEEMARTMANKAEYRKATEAKQSHRVQIVAKHVMDAYAQDFKAMIEAGMLSLTAGEEEGEIDKIPSMVDSHLDSIKVKVDAATTDEDLKIPAVVAITQIMADTMLNQYFLTRNAFIRVRGHKYNLFSYQNERLGIHSNKRGAIRQLRLIEYKNRHGLGD
jgi:hypothetical protein